MKRYGFVTMAAWLTLLALFGAALTASAQFTSLGDDPGTLRWRQVESAHYRIVYPVGTDTLAQEYARALEKYYPAENRSLGFLPGEYQRRKLPVVMHAFTTIPNGAVTWAPRRMELYAAPDAYGSDPCPWVEQLAVHESRHAAQMQFGYRGAFKAGGWLLGEMWQGALAAIYPNQALLEGDAVAAETALTTAGRARTASFLNYYRMAFDSGDWRNFYRWRHGSYRHYTPDYYTSGYMLIAGMRYLWDAPSFTEDYFRRVIARPLRIGNLQKEVRSVSGKPFREAWQDIMEAFRTELSARTPVYVDPARQLTAASSWYTAYTGGTMAGGRMLVMKDGLRQPKNLVEIHPDGSETSHGAFSYLTSQLSYSPGTRRIYWSETVSDPRWGMKKTSRIRYLSMDDFRKHDLTGTGRLYNPVSDGKRRLAAVEYPVEGGSAIVILDAVDGTRLGSIPAPDSLQLTLPAWHGEHLYSAGLSEHGYGIYSIREDGTWEMRSAPSRQKIIQLFSRGDHLEYVSDLSGSDELYSFNPGTGEVLRLTHSRYGASGYFYDSDTLCYSAHTHDGDIICRTAVRDLSPESPSGATYTIEDVLSAQEAALKPASEPAPDFALSEPKPYRKLPHLLRFHSWVPLSFSYDQVSSLTLDYDYREAALGATALFQNTLGTASGTVGYSARYSSLGERHWRHGAHAQFTYTGLYPVISASLDFNGRDSREYTWRDITWDGDSYYSIPGAPGGRPYTEGEIEVYIPLSRSRGGWTEGVLPRMEYTINNDIFDTTPVELSYDGSFSEGLPVPRFTGTGSGHRTPMQTLSASLRGYIVRDRAPSQTYPSLGIGLEAGYCARPGLESVYSPDIYIYSYGYLPGVVPQQGLRWSATLQRQLGESRIGESHTGFIPRGFGSAARDYIAFRTRTQGRITADYAIPIYLGDMSFLSPLVYGRHFVLTPHFDCTFFPGGSLYSAGAALTVRLANLLWIPFESSFGFTWSYNGGRSYGRLHEAGCAPGRHCAGLIFSMDI